MVNPDVFASCSPRGHRLRVGQLAPDQSGGLRLPQPSDPPALKSIVQLGDSIASGEGTLYGYTYDSTSKTWTGGNLNVVWPGPYPLSHDAPDA